MFTLEIWSRIVPWELREYPILTGILIMNHTDIQFTFIMFNMKSFIIHAGDIQWPMYILLI